MTIAGVVVAVLVALALPLAADPAPPPAPKPDPVAQRAGGEANLESTEHRRGIVFGAAIGPSVTIGGGTGTGGDLQLKLGHVATPWTVITFVLGGSAQLHKPAMENDFVANNLTYALAGFQHWVGPSLWISLGVGGGTYHCNSCQNDAGVLVNTKRPGVGGGVGAGIDLVRIRGVVLGLEIYSVGLLDRDGLVATNGMSLGLSFD